MELVEADVRQDRIMVSDEKMTLILTLGSLTQVPHAQESQSTIEYISLLVWDTSTREISRSFLFIIQQNEGIQPTTQPL
jgi:hypothetical protein